MNITDHIETIEKWITTSDRDGQLDLLVEVIQRFIIDRFAGRENEKVVTALADVLYAKIGQQRGIIKIIEARKKMSVNPLSHDLIHKS